MHSYYTHVAFPIYSADSPVLWLRVDPDMLMIRHVILEQPDFMWQYMLKYERDIVSQLEVMVLHYLLSVCCSIEFTSTTVLVFHKKNPREPPQPIYPKTSKTVSP